MLILVGPSASGKTEVANILINKYHMKRMITYTTRPIRVGEINHVSYHFVGEEEFLTRKANNEFIEDAMYNGYHYGSNKKDAGSDKIVILEPNGVNSFYNKMGSDVTICFITASESLRKERMIGRGDLPNQIEKRISNDKESFDIKNLQHIDKIFVNENKSLDELALEIFEYYNNN